MEDLQHKTPLRIDTKKPSRRDTKRRERHAPPHQLPQHQKRSRHHYKHRSEREEPPPPLRSHTPSNTVRRWKSKGKTILDETWPKTPTSFFPHEEHTWPELQTTAYLLDSDSLMNRSKEERKRRISEAKVYRKEQVEDRAIKEKREVREEREGYGDEPNRPYYLC